MKLLYGMACFGWGVAVTDLASIYLNHRPQLPGLAWAVAITSVLVIMAIPPLFKRD